MEAFRLSTSPHHSGQPTRGGVTGSLDGFQEWQTGMSCALAYIVLIVVLAITNIYVKYLNKMKER
jgi:multiple sugar transport system permease protein